MLIQLWRGTKDALRNRDGTTVLLRGVHAIERLCATAEAPSKVIGSGHPDYEVNDETIDHVDAVEEMMDLDVVKIHI